MRYPACKRSQQRRYITPTAQILQYYAALGFEPGEPIYIKGAKHQIFTGTYYGDRIELWKARQTGTDSHGKKLYAPDVRVSDPVAFLCEMGRRGDINSYPNHLQGGISTPHTTRFTSLFYEIDDLSLEEQRAKLDWVRSHLKLDPAAVVFSGGKSLHVYFALSDAIDADTWQRLNRMLAIVVGGDPAICTHARAMRLPGVPRVKNGETREVALEHVSESCYSAAEIESRLSAWFPHGLSSERWKKWCRANRKGEEALATQTLHVPEESFTTKPRTERAALPIVPIADLALAVEEVVPLADFLTQTDRDAIANGAPEGYRSNTAYKLAANLIGTARYLTAQGIAYSPAPEALYHQFTSKYDWPDGKGANAWNRVQSANPTPTLPAEAFERKLLKYAKKDPEALPDGLAEQIEKVTAIETTEKRDKLLYWARKLVAVRPLFWGSGAINLDVHTADLATIDTSKIPDDGFVVIVAGTGTGKTVLARDLLQNTEFAHAPGSRISLQRGLAKRLGFTYLTDCDWGANYLIGDDGKPAYRLSYCFDSVASAPLPPAGEFDLLLDEADQSLRHLITGKTCGNDKKRGSRIERCLWLIKNAKRVIALSATLGSAEIEFVQKVRGEKDYFVVRNSYQANSYPVRLLTGTKSKKYSTRNARMAALNVVREALKSGKRVIAPVGELRSCRAIALLGKECGLEPHQVMRFDSQTSTDDLQQEFADDPNGFLASHDIRLLVHSPSLTSGVSIEGDHFDICIGHFDGQSINPDDVLQALARVRKPIPRVVYASHYGVGNRRNRAFRSADFLERQHKRTTEIEKLLGIEYDRQTGDPIAEYHATTEAERNAMMCSFGVYVQALLEAAGHDVTLELDSPDADASWWNALLKVVDRQQEREIHSADQISDERAEQLRAKKVLPYAERCELERYNISQFYNFAPADLPIEAIQWDSKGKKRRAISRLEAVLWGGLALTKDKDDWHQLTWQKDRYVAEHDLPDRTLQSTGGHVVAPILEKCLELAERGEYWDKSDAWVQNEVAKLRDRADEIETALGFKIHPKMTDCQIVGMILKFYGLDTTSVNIRTGGGRLRRYTLDVSNLVTLMRVLDKRAKRHEDNGYALEHTHQSPHRFLMSVNHPIPALSERPLEQLRESKNVLAIAEYHKRVTELATLPSEVPAPF